MDLRKAVANWYACDYGRLRCLGEKQCLNYVWVDPRTWSKTGVGPGTTGKRTLCSLLDDLDEQIKAKTET